ncbi:unnamed protein product [Angiostrongylus costaricensis]|uniref:Transmembrane protein n=1 Tax=Angiostrongylus costaricensis TaxID=334426 RepID=A0A0R3PUX7_ANGCS|nr:unnamed protein product [Angiostrongylus costaricensis]
MSSLKVFERVEHDEHDDITYAPEIQSVEIPPDQMSENSDNLQEYFDRAATEERKRRIHSPMPRLIERKSILGTIFYFYFI